MENIGLTTMMGMIQFIGFMAVLVLALVCAILFLRYKMENNVAKVFAKDIDYEVFYKDECILSGSFPLKNGESRRFGFSKKSDYHNDIILEHHLDKIEDLDEDDVERMKEEYGTWFDVKMFAGEFSVAVAYTSKERYKGNKKVYLEEGVLNREGEAIQGDMHIYSDKDSRKAVFRIDLYDESKKVE